MAEMNNWVKNMARSFGYAAKDAFKSYNPVLSNMIEETKDTKDELFSDISDLKSEFSISEERTLFQELKESGKDAFKNLFDDIKTGNLYNKDRQKAADNMMASALGFDLSDFEFDSSDFDDWGDDDWTADDSAKAEVAQSVKNTAATIRGMDMVGEKISESVSTATAESGRQIVKATRDGSKALYALNRNGFNNVSKALMQVNDNIVSFAKVTEPMTQHFNNSTIFFTKTTETLEKIEQHLAHMDRAADAKEVKYYDKGIGEIFSEDTGISVHAMYDMIKKNLKDDAWILDLAKDGMKNIRNMKMQGNSIGDSLPVGVWITKAITNVMIPKVFSEAMKEMNKNIATFTGSALMNLRDSNLFGKINDSLFGVLDYFVPQSSSKQKINTGNYEKGAVAWDGVSKKALTEVIPEYLSMIYGAISGVNKKYDYNSGKFIDFKTIKKDIDERKMREAKYAGGGYYDDAKAIAKKMGYTDEQAEEMLGKYFYNAVFGSDDQRKLAMKVNRGDFTVQDRETLGIDEKTLKLLQNTIQDYIKIMNKPVATRSKEDKEKARNFNKARVSLEAARNSYADSMSSEEVSGISNMRYLLNNGSHGATIDNKGIKFSEFGNINDTLKDLSYTVKTIIPNYLQLMLYELNGHSGYMYWSDRQQRMRRNKAPKYYKANGSLVNVVAGSQTNTNSHNNGHQQHTQGQGGSGQQQNAGSADDEAAPEPQYDIDIRDLAPDEVDPNSNDDAATRKEKSKFGKLVDKITGGVKGFFGRWKTKDPEKAGKIIGGISNILNAVSYSVNTMFMGTSDDERKNNGLLGVLKAEVKNMFSGFTKFYEDFLKDHLDNIRDKIKEKFDEIFDKNEKLGDLRDRAKEWFKDSKDRAVEWMGGTVEELMFGTKEAKQRKFERDNKRYENNLQKMEELVQNLMSQATEDNPVDVNKARKSAAQQIFGVDNPEDVKPVAPKFAYGTNYVPKTGLAILSEGEMVIPTELNPFYNRPTNKANQIAKEKAIENKYFGRFAGGTKDVEEKKNRGSKRSRYRAYKHLKETKPEFYDGIEGKKNFQKLIDRFGMDEIEDRIVKEKVSKNVENMGGIKKILYAGFAESVNKAGRKLEDFVDKAINGDKKDNDNKESVDKIKSKALEITSSIFDKDKNQRKQNAANAGAGALLGAGASILTGCIVGPLFGAALGAGVGLIANNTKMQRAIFGEDNIDEDGNFNEKTGGKGLKGKIAKFVKQQLPDTLKAGGIGAAAGLFLGHPLLGAIIGSGIGFVKNSDAAKDALFGKIDDETKERKGGIIPKNIQEFVKKGLPKALIGGAIGLLAGPFGAIPNLILGSSLGLYTQTEQFKDDFFGKDGDKKSQKESFVGQVKEKILDDVTSLGKNAKNLLKSFFKSLGIGVKSKLRSLGDWVKDKLENPKTGIGRVLTAVPRFLMGAGKKALGILGAPARILDTAAQKANLKYGADVYDKVRGRNLTASERAARRKTNEYRVESSTFSSYDDLVASLNKEQFDELQGKLAEFKNLRSSTDKNKIIQDLLNSEKFNSKALSEEEYANLSDEDRAKYDETKKDEQTKKNLISKLLRSDNKKGFRSDAEIQRMLDLGKTENEYRDWEIENGKKTEEYQYTVVDRLGKLLDIAGKIAGIYSKKTGEFNEGYGTYTDKNGITRIGKKQLKDNVSFGNDGEVVKKDGVIYRLAETGSNGEKVYYDDEGNKLTESDLYHYDISAEEQENAALKREVKLGAVPTAVVGGVKAVGTGAYIAGKGIVGASKAVGGAAGKGAQEVGKNAQMEAGFLSGKKLEELDPSLVATMTDKQKQEYENRMLAKEEQGDQYFKGKIFGMDTPYVVDKLGNKAIHALEEENIKNMKRNLGIRSTDEIEYYGLNKTKELHKSVSIGNDGDVVKRGGKIYNLAGTDSNGEKIYYDDEGNKLAEHELYVEVVKALRENTEAIRNNTDATEENSDTNETGEKKRGLKDRIKDKVRNLFGGNREIEYYDPDNKPASAARGGIFHVSSRVPFAGNFSGLPYWGNYGLGDLAAGAWNGVKNVAGGIWNGAKNVVTGLGKTALGIGAGALAAKGIGDLLGKAIGAGKRVKNAGSAFMSALRGEDINISGGAAGGGGAGSGGMETTETEQGTKTYTSYDMFGNPHQYSKKADGEMVQVTNDKETDASNAMLGEFNASVGTVPVIATILTNMSRTIASIAGKVGSGGGSGEGGNGEGGSGNGKGGGVGDALKTAGAAGLGGGLLASARAFLKNVGAPLAGIGLATGAFDSVAEKIGNTSLFKGNDTKSVFSGQTTFIGGHQVQIDSHGKPIVNDQGYYITGDGNYMNPETGELINSMGESIGFADVTDVKQLGTDNTAKTAAWRNLGVQTVMNAKKGAGLAENIISGFRSGKSVLGNLMNGRMAQNAGHAMFGGQIVTKNSLRSRLFRGAPKYSTSTVQGIVPSLRNKGANLVNGIRNRISNLAPKLKNGASAIGNGIRNKISSLAPKRFSTLGKIQNGVKGAVRDVASVIDDIFAKIVKSFQDGKLSKLIPQNVRAKIGKFFTSLKEELIPQLTKSAGNGAKSLANQLDEILVALKIPLIVGAAVNGWGNAPSYLGVITPYQELSAGAKFLAAALNALNMAIPVIGGLIPTKVFYTLFFNAAKLVFGGAGWEWLDKWEADRLEAEQTVLQYCQENGINPPMSIEEYNEMNGNAGALTMTGHAWKEDVGQLGRTLDKEIKEEGLFGTIGNIGKGFMETVKDDGLGKMALDTMNESFIAQGMKGVNNGLSNAVDKGVAEGNVAATAYDKAMSTVGDAIVWGGDKLNDLKGWLSGGRSGLPAGRGTSDKNFISQVNPAYSGIRVGNSTVDENGCAPAVASMIASDYGKKLSIQSAANKAGKYQEGTNGTTINYFGDTLAEQGIGTGVLSNMQQVLGNLKQGNSVILLGQDPNNNSKDLSPFGPSNHYVLASGVDKSGKLIIKDPENTKPALYDPSILGSTTMAIGTSLNGSSMRATGNIKSGPMMGRARRRGIGSSLKNSAGFVKNALSKVGNAGKNLFANAKNLLGNIFGKGSKGQAYPAEIWSWLHQTMGLNDYQTAAVQGCFQCESGNSPYCIEGYYLRGFPGYEAVATNEGMDNFVVNVLFPAYAKSNIKINQSAYQHDGHYYPGIGLPQWTGSRSYKLFKFARENGKNWYDLPTQLDFLKGEFNSSYSGVISKLKNTTNIEDATEVFAVGFENGNFKKGTKAYNERLEAAKAIYNTYSNQPLADVSSLPTSEATGGPIMGHSVSTATTAGAVAGTAASSISQSITAAAQGDGSILDKLNAVFAAALGGMFGIGSANTGTSTSTGGTEGGAGGYYDENGNWVSTGGVDLGPLSNLDGPNKLIEIAKSQLGYQEKASNSQLDDPHANVGSANYTKYGAFSGANGAPWCGSFVSWVFDQVVGGDREKFKTLLRSNDNNLPRSMAAVSNILDLAKKTGSFTNEPQKGDIVIYKNGTSHTGIVSDVSNGQFSTIEGNTSGTPAGFDRDGGVVAAKGPRDLSYGKLTGFLRPDWSAVFPPTSGDNTAKYSAKDFYAEPGSVYIDTTKFTKNIPAQQINAMKANGTLYDYALKNEPQAIGYVNKNIVSSHSSSIFGSMPTDAVKGTIQSKINDNSFGAFIHEKMPSAIGFVDTSKITPKGGMPQNEFDTMVNSYKTSGDYSRWVLDNYNGAVSYAGKGSGINSYVSKYQTNRATRALNNWVKPVVNTDTSASMSKTYSGKASGMTTTQPAQPPIKINTTAVQGIAKNIAQNSKDSNVNYQDLLIAIIKLLNAIAENTGAGGSLYSAIAQYLPAGSNVSKEDLESIAKLSSAAMDTALSAKTDINSTKNTGNRYGANRGIMKVRGDLAKVQYMG